MAFNDGQVSWDGAITKGLSYSPLNQLSNEPLFTFESLLQAKISGKRGEVVSQVKIPWVVSPPRIYCTTLKKGAVFRVGWGESFRLVW